MGRPHLLSALDSTLEPVPVIFVKAVGGPAGARQAFEILESVLGGHRGRRFYGTYDSLTREYLACVEEAKGDDRAAMKVGRWTIPGGKFATRKITDWQSKIPSIASTFDEMANDRKYDPHRPSIEFYRSESELVLYLPVSD